jgi:hypothetical protein
MVHDDRHAREILRKFHGFSEVPPGRLELEHEAACRE